MKPRFFAIAATTLSPFLVFACDDIGGQIDLATATFGGAAGSTTIIPSRGGNGGSAPGFGGTAGAAGKRNSDGGDAGASGARAGGAGGSEIGGAGGSAIGGAGGSEIGGAGGSEVGGAGGAIGVAGSAGSSGTAGSAGTNNGSAGNAGTGGGGGAGGSGSVDDICTASTVKNSAFRYGCCGFLNAFGQTQENYIACGTSVCFGSCTVLASLQCGQCVLEAASSQNCTFDFTSSNQRKALQACVEK